MVAGDLVKFKFKYEPMVDVFIYPGDLGVIKSKALWFVEVLHLNSGTTILLKSGEFKILEKVC